MKIKVSFVWKNDSGSTFYYGMMVYDSSGMKCTTTINAYDSMYCYNNLRFFTIIIWMYWIILLYLPTEKGVDIYCYPEYNVKITTNLS